LVQTNQSFNSSKEGNIDPLDDVPQPNMVKTAKGQEVFKSRLVSTIGPDFGRHIDANPSSRTPLTNMNVDSTSTDLAKSVPEADFMSSDVKIHTQFGFRSAKKGRQAAETADTPRATLPDAASGSQNFETTALAIDGAQKGIYYGSVKWGWRKDAGKTSPDPIDFQKSKDAAPSPSFAAAARAWNASKNTKDEASIPLPISDNKVLTTSGDLLDKPDPKGKRVASLGKGTAVGTFDDATHPDWVKVIVTSSQYASKMGWIKTSQLTDPPPDQFTPKKKK
jgi:hypothetical protein